VSRRPFITYRPMIPVALLAGILGFGLVLISRGITALVLISAIVIILSIWLMQKAVGLFNLRALTLPGFFYLVYVAIILIPSFFVYAEQIDPYRTRYLFAVESVLLTVPLGVMLMKQLFKFHNRETVAFYRSSLQPHRSDVSVMTFVSFLGLAWTLTLVYVREVKEIPLFYMLGHPGESEMFMQLREESLKLLDSPLRYAYALLSSTLYPFLILFAFARYLQTKQRAWACLFVASFLSGSLFAGFTVAKAPLAALLLMVCGCYYVYKGGRVGAKFVVSLVVLFLAFPFFVTTREYASGADPLAAIEAIGQRIFYAPALGLYWYFEVFPDVVLYQYGATMGRLAWTLGRKPFPTENIVGLYASPHGLASVHANAAFLGNMNADFGMAGCLIGGLLAGVLMQAAQVYIVRRGKSAMNAAIYSILLFNVAWLNSTALPVVLLSQGAIPVFLLAWSMRAIDSVLPKRPGIVGLPTRAKGLSWVKR
jgi:oligosaccharide repeat unit polymerase